jgi:hypothetical protein
MPQLTAQKQQPAFLTISPANFAPYSRRLNSTLSLPQRALFFNVTKDMA